MTVCGHAVKHKNSSRVVYALLLNLLMMSAEFFVAYWTGSQAIFASAIHDFGDSLALGLSVVLQVVAAKPPDSNYPFGYARFELLAAIVVGIIVFSSNLFIFYEISNHFYSGLQNYGTDLSRGMIIVSVVGILINAFAFKLMHGEHSHHERALSLHFLQDTANWVLVLVGGILIYFFKWRFIDSVLALGIAGFMSFSLVKGMGRNFSILMQRTPHNVDLKVFKDEITKITGANSLLSVKIWSLDGIHHVANFSFSSLDLQVRPQILEVCRNFHITEFFIEIGKN